MPYGMLHDRNTVVDKTKDKKINHKSEKNRPCIAEKKRKIIDIFELDTLLQLVVNINKHNAETQYSDNNYKELPQIGFENM